MTIVIIGGGAAGMMAAATCLELGTSAQIILVEKNALLGRKVIISGGGRCNVTTGVHNVRELLRRYERGQKFLTSAMYTFPPDRVYQWFEDHGVPLKTEEDLRVFPQSNDGKDIVRVFETMFSASRVEVLLKASACRVQKRDGNFVIGLKSGRSLLADVLILTTGGQTYRHTGSTGDGYQFAESLGHHITPLAVSLNSFLLAETWPKELAGVSFGSVTIYAGDTKQHQATGPMVFTHQGISGPVVFALSAKVAFTQYTSQEPLPIFIDFLPSLTHDIIQSQLDSNIHTHPKQLFSKTLQAWLPKSVIKAFMHNNTVSNNTLSQNSTNASVSKLLRHVTSQWLKACPVQAIGRGAGSEFITAGGVDTSEVNPNTMESLMCPGLLFAGEILNIDGFTGGYNLQAAWATGRLAGTRASEIV